MGKLIPPVRKPVVILCNGEFPRHKIPVEILKSSGTLVCTDGSADRVLQTGVNPNIIIGDLDSLTMEQKTFQGMIIKNEDQNTSDLEKAIVWCIENGAKSVTILGATGKREDHTLANFQIMMKYDKSIDLRMVTDDFIILFVDSKKEFKSVLNRKISILPIIQTRSVTTTGLKYELNRASLPFGSLGISNIAIEDSVSIKVKDGGVLIFIAHSS